MTLWHRFLGRFDSFGMFTFGLGERERYDALKRELTGQEAEMLIAKRRVKRNLPQNAKLHALAHELAKDTGHTVEELKREAVIQALGPVAGITRFSVAGREYMEVRHTSALSKDECSLVIEWLVEQCQFVGVRPPKDEQIEVMD